MRHKLTKDNVDALLQRFNAFFDGMIRHVQLELMPSLSRMTIVVDADDMQDMELQPYGMDSKVKRVTFEVEGLIKYIIQQPENYQLVLIMGMNIGFFNHNVYLDFTSYRNSKTKEDYVMVSLPRKSQLVVVGKKCFWSVEGDVN